MNPPRYDAAVDALRRVLTDLVPVSAAVLFGSAAMGTATEQSDIDLLVGCPPEARGRVRDALAAVGHEFDVPVTSVLYDRGELSSMDTQFLESILRQGKVLKGTLPALTPADLDLEPLRLVTYQTTGLHPRMRARLLRELDGYRTRKTVGRRHYRAERKGLLAQAGGWRVGRGAIVVPEGASSMLDAVFTRYGAKRMLVAIWCQRP